MGRINLTLLQRPPPGKIVKYRKCRKEVTVTKSCTVLKAWDKDGRLALLLGWVNTLVSLNNAPINLNKVPVSLFTGSYQDGNDNTIYNLPGFMSFVAHCCSYDEKLHQTKYPRRLYVCPLVFTKCDFFPPAICPFVIRNIWALVSYSLLH